MQHDAIRTARDSNNEIRTVRDAVIILTSRSRQFQLHELSFFDSLYDRRYSILGNPRRTA
jgi:hypothetical protein